MERPQSRNNLGSKATFFSIVFLSTGAILSVAHLWGGRKFYPSAAVAIIFLLPFAYKQVFPESVCEKPTPNSKPFIASLLYSLVMHGAAALCFLCGVILFIPPVANPVVGIISWLIALRIEVSMIGRSYQSLCRTSRVLGSMVFAFIVAISVIYWLWQGPDN